MKFNTIQKNTHIIIKADDKHKATDSDAAALLLLQCGLLHSLSHSDKQPLSISDIAPASDLTLEIRSDYSKFTHKQSGISIQFNKDESIDISTTKSTDNLDRYLCAFQNSFSIPFAKYSDFGQLTIQATAQANQVFNSTPNISSSDRIATIYMRKRINNQPLYNTSGDSTCNTLIQLYKSEPTPHALNDMLNKHIARHTCEIAKLKSHSTGWFSEKKISIQEHKLQALDKIKEALEANADVDADEKILDATLLPKFTLWGGQRRHSQTYEVVELLNLHTSWRNSTNAQSVQKLMAAQTTEETRLLWANTV